MSHAANPVPNAEPPPLRVTLVHHEQMVRDFVAEVASAERWRFDAYPDFPDAGRALGVALHGQNGLPAITPSGSAPCNPVTHGTHLTGPQTDAPPAAAGPHVFLAALCPPKGPCGLEWTRRLAVLNSSLLLVLLAGPAEAALGLSAIYSGAWAFILWPPRRTELLTAIERAAIGRRFVSPAAVEASLDALCCPEPAPSCTGLTPAEIKVLWAMALGRGEKGVSRLLPITVKTVHAHSEHIHAKLGVHTLPEALDKGFGTAGCAYLCLRRERERERERENDSQEETLIESAVGDDNRSGNQPYSPVASRENDTIELGQMLIRCLTAE